MNVWYIIAAIIAIVIAVISGVFTTLGIVGKKKNTVIQFKISMADWFMPLFFIFVMITCFIVIEYLLDELVISIISKVEGIGWGVLELFNGGIFIVLFLPLLSFVVARMARWFDLDYLETYNVNIIKFFITFVILVDCIAFGIISNRIGLSNNHYTNWINRLSVWVVSAISIWITIGLGCKGRAEKTTNENDKTKRGIKTILRKIKFLFVEYKHVLICCLPVIGILAVPLWSIEKANIIVDIVLLLAAFWGAGCISTLLVYIFVNTPSKRISDSRLKSAIKRRECEKEHHFERCIYKLTFFGETKIEKVQVRVEKRIIKNSDGQEIKDELFDERINDFKYKNDETIIKDVGDYLHKIDNDRNDYLQKAFEECKKKYIEKVEEIIQ